MDQASAFALAIGVAAAIIATYRPAKESLDALGDIPSAAKDRAKRNIVVRCVAMPLLFVTLAIAPPESFVFTTFGVDPRLGFFIAAVVGLLAGGIQALFTKKKPAGSD